MTNKPSQQQPAEGQDQNERPNDHIGEVNKMVAPPTTISPTEEELKSLANQYGIGGESGAFYAFMHGFAEGQRTTRQGGEDWEALYISEHLNLLAAKRRIAELEKEITEWKWKLNDAKVINERLISDDHASGWLGLSDEDLVKTVRQYFETLNK